MSRGFLQRNCPSCGWSQTVAPTVRAHYPAETMTFEELIPFWRGFRSSTCFFSYVRCEECELLFCPNYFSQPQLDILYSFMDDNSMGNSATALERTQHQYAKLSLSAQGKTKRVLEFGADAGLLVRELKRLEPLLVVDAIEPNRKVWPLLKAEITPDGRVYSSLDDLDGELPFDLIVGIHVLDHLLDPVAYLRSLRNRLEPNGSVVLVTHDESSLLRNVLHRRWAPFCLQHPQLFHAGTISSMLTIAGYKDSATQKTMNYVSMRSGFEILAASLGLPKKLSLAVPKIEVGLRLGNIMTCARKS